MKIYINGRYHDRQTAAVSVFDHGLLYGDGIFEGIRIYNGRIFRLAEHIDRLYLSARALLLDIPLTRDEMAAAVADAVAVNEKREGYIRLIVTRGEGALGLDPASCGSPNVIIIVSDIAVYPAAYYEKGIEAIVASTLRTGPACLDGRIKSLNYLNNIMARIEARRAGALEAIMLNAEGYVVECSADNIFIVREGVLLTPAAHLGALAGITRDTVLALANEAGIETREGYLTRYDLYTAHECFLTGTGAEIMPVVSIDGRTIGDGEPGTVTRRITADFRELVAGEVKKNLAGATTPAL